MLTPIGIYSLVNEGLEVALISVPTLGAQGRCTALNASFITNMLALYKQHWAENKPMQWPVKSTQMFVWLSAYA